MTEAAGTSVTVTLTDACLGLPCRSHVAVTCVLPVATACTMPLTLTEATLGDWLAQLTAIPTIGALDASTQVATICCSVPTASATDGGVRLT